MKSKTTSLLVVHSLLVVLLHNKICAGFHTAAPGFFLRHHAPSSKHNTIVPTGNKGSTCRNAASSGGNGIPNEQSFAEAPVYEEIEQDKPEEELTDALLWSSLRKRISTLEAERKQHIARWKGGKCNSTIRFALSKDWIRRVAMEKYPVVACGSASGRLHVVDLEEQELICTSKDLHDADGGDETFLEYLFGKYDGGGVLALAISGSIIFSSGREGGLHVSGYSGKDSFIALGYMESMGVPSSRLKKEDQRKPRNYVEPPLVTAIHTKGDMVWVGTATGEIHAFPLSRGATPLITQSPSYVVKDLHGAAVLGIDVDLSLRIGVCALSNGQVKLFRLESNDEGHPGEVVASWRFARNVPARSVAIVLLKNGGAAVVCGCGDGTMAMSKLRMDDQGRVVGDRHFLDPLECQPPHRAAVVDLAVPIQGLLISGSQDGSLRVWNVNQDTSNNVAMGEPSCLYQLVGYKVWMGSVFTDGKRIVSDGSDNTIVVHDFSSGSESEE